MKKLIFGYGETGKAVEQFFINNKIDFEIYDDNISNFNRERVRARGNSLRETFNKKNLNIW